jgi:preprotein translocase subunit SecA
MYDSSSKVAEEEDAKRDEVGSYKVFYDFLKSCSRQEAYRADITYGTNNEFGFDYLRDNIGYNKDQIVQHTHHYAIVDEIDSILIDEARTPLIISAPAQESSDMYKRFAQIAESLIEGDDYTVDEKQRAIALTESGITKAENCAWYFKYLFYRRRAPSPPFGNCSEGKGAFLARARVCG